MKLPFVPRVEPMPALPLTAADIVGIKAAVAVINEVRGHGADLSLPPYWQDTRGRYWSAAVNVSCVDGGAYRIQLQKVPYRWLVFARPAYVADVAYQFPGGQGMNLLCRVIRRSAAAAIVSGVRDSTVAALQDGKITELPDGTWMCNEP